MAATPSPTPEQVFETLPLVDQRISVALTEIVRRLREELPGLIEHANTELRNAAPGKGIPVVAKKDIRIAPASLKDTPMNCVLVSGSVQTQTLSPAIFKNEGQVIIFSIEEKMQGQHDDEIPQMFDRAGLIRGFLYHFLTGCKDPMDRIAWRLLEPQLVTALPEPYENLSGTACYYRLVQTPDQNNWI